MSTTEYLKFECGARIPENGYLKQPFQNMSGSKPRPKDGRVALVTFAIPSCPTQPVMSDGSKAPCMFGCPKKRASGRKMIRTWPDDDYKPEEPFSERMGYVVTCYPEVIRDTIEITE